MYPSGNPQGVYGLRCIRCGHPLDLPHDPRLLHIDCPYCGQDNVLPPDLIAARQRQHALDLEHAARAKAAAEHAAQKARKARGRALFFGGIALFAFLFVGTCAAIGIKAASESEAEKLRAADPKVNGHAAMLGVLEKMRAESGCDRILVQPRTHRREVGTVSLDMVAGDHCVHVLGTSGTGAPVTLKYTSQIALTRPVPPAAPLVDYRLCASQGGTHAFTLETSAEPFTVAAIECPRRPEEGGSRSKANDPLSTGKERVGAQLKELVKAGCKKVIAEPQVSKGTQSFTLTSGKNGECFNFLLGSYYSDVTFDVSLKNPNGNAMAVPKPSSKMRVLYCPTLAGKYTLGVTPSTSDHYAHASVDCPRRGPEGLARERELKKLLHGG